MSLRMTVNISQRPMLIMTPKLKQAIEILQMNRIELSQHITQQMEQNPVLEETYEENVDLNTTDETETLEEQIPESNLDVETGLPDEDIRDLIHGKDEPELDITSDDFGDSDWERYFDDTFPVT
ncbi:hypothetical protein FJZ33_08150, partial [Candidatus Poribacteria bacterium]|nr:hypothetical protein [Candidatus Poribacteria bacterium]